MMRDFCLIERALVKLIARQLHEDRAFRLKVRSDKRIPHVEEVTVNEATILMEEENNDEN